MAFLDRAGDFRTRLILESDKPGENEVLFEEKVTHTFNSNVILNHVGAMLGIPPHDKRDEVFAIRCRYAHLSSEHLAQYDEFGAPGGIRTRGPWFAGFIR